MTGQTQQAWACLFCQTAGILEKKGEEKKNVKKGRCDNAG
jgi:hypothetical protein